MAEKKDSLFIIISIICLIGSFILSLSYIAFVAVILCGIPIFKECIEGLISEFDIKADLLVSIAIIASIIIGEVFAAGEIATIMAIGGFLEEYTVSKTQGRIEELIKLTPQVATRLKNGIEEKISVENVQVGDILKVLPGESIPTDGVILKGETSIDQSTLTGESMPVDKKENDEVCSVTKLTELPKDAGRAISLSVLCQNPFDPQNYGMSKNVFYHAAWGALYRKDFLTANNLQFPVGQKKAQDSVFNTQVYACAGKIAYLPYVMYYYRKNPMGITKRYSADNAKNIDTIIRNQLDCMQKIYPDDEEVKKLYLRNRLVALTIDRMRLDIFHKDNPKPRNVRIAEFKELLDTEPYKSAINEFDFGESDKRWWMLPMEYARRKNFTLVEMCFKYDKLFHIIGKLKIHTKSVR